MKTGVNSTVQHNLSPAANAVVTAAINEAKRRAHGQVQPLHVAAILVLPGNPLKEACMASDDNPPMEGRGLELCFNIAMERLATNADKAPSPTLSNALVAALKRAQAHQRRGTPDQSLQPMLAVKVEMDQLMISILDDPSVSRVMSEAGFSSKVVKSNLEEAVAAQATLAASSSSSLDSNNQLIRRRLPMGTPFAPSLDATTQLRQHGLYSVPPHFGLEVAPTELGLMERGGRMMINGSGGGGTTLLDVQGMHRENAYMGSLPRHEADHPLIINNNSLSGAMIPSFLEKQKLNRMSAMFSGAMDSHSFRSSSSTLSSSLDENCSNVVEVLISSSGSGIKRRNPVLVSDTSASASGVVKEFTQRLQRGNLHELLQGVQLLTLPVDSLKVGVFSEEETEQKLVQLRGMVEKAMPRGAIVHVGDLQWLVDSAGSETTSFHAHAMLVVKEIEQLLSAHSENPFWILASANNQTFRACQFSSPFLGTSWGLQMVAVTQKTGPSAMQIPRYVSNQNNIINELSFASQISCGNGNELEKSSQCCPECSAKFQQECALLTSSPATRPQLSWMQAQTSMEILQVKEEKSFQSQKVEELRQKWHRKCSSEHHQIMRLANFAPNSSAASAHDALSSPPPTGPSPSPLYHPEKSPAAMVHPLMASSISSWVPEPVKPFAGKPTDLTPHLLRSGSFKSAPGSDQQSALNGGGISLGRVSAGNFVGGANWRKDIMGANNLVSIKANNLVNSVKANIPQIKPTKVGTELALGRGNVERCSLIRDLKEGGQQPLRMGFGGGVSSPQLSFNSHPLSVRQDQLPTTAAAAAAGGDRMGFVGRSGMMLRGVRPSSANTSPSIFRKQDDESLKGLAWSLSNAVHWQTDASAATAHAVMKSRLGQGMLRGSKPRGDTWLMFLGPDKVGQKEMAKSLAKLVFGCEKNLIWFKFDPSIGGPMSSCGSFGSCNSRGEADCNGVNYRGKTPLDRLVQAVAQKPLSVVVLEDVDQADLIVRGNLRKAMERGKLADSSSGLEVSITNAIFILTCGAGASLLTKAPSHGGTTDEIRFDEEKLRGLVSPRGCRLVVEDFKSEKVLHKKSPRLSVVECSADDVEDQEEVIDEKPAESMLLFGSRMYKRKAPEPSSSVEEGSCSSSAAGSAGKRRKKKSPGRAALGLDLNLSTEENMAQEEREESAAATGGGGGEESSCSDRRSSGGAAAAAAEKQEQHRQPAESLERLVKRMICRAQEALPKEYFHFLDATVVFKPFNLDGLTSVLLEKLHTAVEDTLKPTATTITTPVEIDIAMLELMVSSAWQAFADPDAFEGWINKVFAKSISAMLESKSGVVGPDSVIKFQVEKDRGRAAAMAMVPAQEPTDNSFLLPPVIRIVAQ